MFSNKEQEDTARELYELSKLDRAGYYEYSFLITFIRLLKAKSIKEYEDLYGEK